MSKHALRTYLPVIIALAVASLIVLRFDDVCGIVGTVWSAVEPLAVGAVLAYLLNFVAAFWESVWFPKNTKSLVIRTRRPICVILAVATATLVIAALVMFVTSEFKSVGSAIVSGLAEAATMASQAITQLPGGENALVLDNATVDSLAEQALSAVGGASEALRIVAHTGGEVAHFAICVLLGMMFALYLLLDKNRVKAGATRLVQQIPSEQVRERLLHAYRITNDCFSRFIRGQCIEAVILGVLCALGCLVLRFPYATSIGLIVGVTSLVPFAGAWIGGIVGAAMIFSQDPLQAVQFVIFLVVLQQIEGHLIYPNVVGQSVGLPSIWVFVAVIAGGSLFGLLGVLIGVPVISTIRTLVMEHFEKADKKAGSFKPAEKKIGKESEEQAQA
ncbi:AI-2E family transporter [uncultured Ellagibacter sp.]|mgnify:CR=1 FL=1|uniref:AI-2E family transporter n=1 Tax=uncultured Ellagibacter sp. TaxID=2137580 RepID=UPI002601CEE5|nr:AI-2E family transporter [uncultured Ellagibacter sp.]